MFEYAARLSLYGLTAERLERAARLTPHLAGVVGQTVDAYVAAAARMPNVGPIFQRHDAEIASRLRTHFDTLFSGRIEAAYTAKVAELAQWEADIGLDARARAIVGNRLLCACLAALAGRRPIGSRAVAEQGALIAQLLAFDLASTITAHHEGAKASALQRYENLTRELTDFNTSMDAISGTVQQTAQALSDFSVGLKASAGAAEQATETVAQVLDSATSKVGVASDAAQRIVSSCQEIGALSDRGAVAGTETLGQIERAGRSMEALRMAMSEVANVSSLIGGIAGQTNLLALNATIEAARAGEAGRGFAVVAAEVKALADETAAATTRIERLVRDIDGAARATSGDLDAIRATMGLLHETSRGLSEAVRHQTCDAHRITESVGDASVATRRAYDEAGVIASTASRGVGMAHDLGAWTTKLNATASDLRGNVNAFAERLRRA